jgi:hypothetical protein
MPAAVDLRELIVANVPEVMDLEIPAAQQRSPVIEEASGGAGAPIYKELRRFTFTQQQICYFFLVDHQQPTRGMS